MNNKIKNLASICLNNSQYNKLNNLLQDNRLDRARIYLDDLIEEIENKINSSTKLNFNELDLEHRLLLQVENEIFNLYEKEDEREQIKQIT